MNSKQSKALRRAIREQYPNIDKGMAKKLFREGKRQFNSLTANEKGQDVINID